MRRQRKCEERTRYVTATSLLTVSFSSLTREAITHTVCFEQSTIRRVTPRASPERQPQQRVASLPASPAASSVFDNSAVMDTSSQEATTITEPDADAPQQQAASVATTAAAARSTSSERRRLTREEAREVRLGEI